MKKTIQINNQKLEYTLKVSRKARSMRIAVHPDGHVVVAVPRIMNFDFFVEKFIKGKADWIFEKIAYFKSKNLGPFIKSTRADYLSNKGKAQKLVEEKIAKFNKIYNYKIGRITIKNQKTRWGSCSKRGNLNFNYKIALIPEKLADYIVVHEICHLGELNHSKKFWNLVEKAIPDYKSLRGELNRIGINYQ